MHQQFPLVCLVLAASAGVAGAQFSGGNEDGFSAAAIFGTGLDTSQAPPAWMTSTATGGIGDGFSSAGISGVGLDPTQAPPAWVATTATGGIGDGFSSSGISGVGLDPTQAPPAWVATTATGGIGDGFSSAGISRVGLDGAELHYVIRVAQGATGANDGSSWANARTDLQAAINAAEPGDAVWVLGGTYRPNDANPANMSRSQWFQMKNGVAIYGGFTGSETSLEQRDPVAQPTILSGDLAGNDTDADGDGYPDAATMTDNTFHVVYNPATLGLHRSAVLDGFTILGGNANGSGGTDRGGGIYNDGASPTIRGCVLTGNRAGSFGGAGIFNSGGTPLVTDCTISWNHAQSNVGGGIYNAGSSATLANCSFISNFAPNGGGVGNWNCVSDITNCTFVSNRATVYGGAIYNSSVPSGKVANCTLWRNSAASGGGGMLNNTSSNPLIVNTVLWENSGGELANLNSSSPSVSNCIVLGGYSGGSNIVADNPLLLPLGNYGGPTPTMPLSPGSPAINAGMTGTSVPVTDQRGFPRDLTPDIGSVETQSGGTLLVEIAAASLPESSGNGATTLSVTRSGSTTAQLVVGLVSSDTSEVTVPATVIIPAGQSSASVTVDVHDDAQIDGDQAVTVAAWATGMAEGADVLNVLDDDGTYVPAGTVSGTWPTSALPYFVAGNISVPTGETLTIEEGNTVLFAAGAQFSVSGTLNVTGSQAAPVIFTSSKPTPIAGDWAGVRFNSGGGQMHWATIEYATTGIYCSHSSPVLNHLVVRNNSSSGILVAASASGCTGGYAAPTITDCEIYGNAGTGVSYSGSGSSFSGCTLPKTGAVAGTLARCSVHHNAAGISISAYDGYFANGSASPVIDHCHIYSNTGAGITTQGDDPVGAKVLHCLIRGNGGAGVRFNALYGGCSVRNCIIVNNSEGVSAGTGASFVFKHNDVWSNTSANFGTGLGSVGVLNRLNQLGVVSDAASNISRDPLFIDADGPDNDASTVGDNNYHLAANSPCVDAGDPTDPYAAEPEDNGDLVNIGIHGNTTEATTSAPGRPVFTAAASDGPGRYLLPIQFDFNSTAEGSGGTYSILQADAGVTGAAIDALTGVFTWTPQLDDSGQTRQFFVGITLAGLTRVTGWAITVVADADSDGMTDQWESDHGLNPLADDGADDGDDDGMTNLIEFAFNLNPTQPDRATVVPGTGTSGLPALTRDDSGPSPVFRFEFLRRKGPGLTYTPQQSGTLGAGTWTTPTGTTTVTNVSSEWERVVITQIFNPAVAGKSFFRVQVLTP